MKIKSKVIVFGLIIFAVVAGILINHLLTINDSSRDLPAKEIQQDKGSTVPAKDEILSQINLGISIIEEAIENFLKANPTKRASDSLNARGESNVERLAALKELKKNLLENKVSNTDAWNKVLEIRDGKR